MHKTIKDNATGVVFDDFVTHTDNFMDEYFSDGCNNVCRNWSSVCDDCSKSYEFDESYLSLGDACQGSICGVKGCNKEADHYYDFNVEKI
jgi:hypothetical protein